MGKCTVHFKVTTIRCDAHTHTVYTMERELASIHRVILSAGAGVQDAWERLPRTQYALECRSTHIMKETSAGAGIQGTYTVIHTGVTGLYT